MRVLIMSDMEGVSGIVVWEQVTGGNPIESVQPGRKLDAGMGSNLAVDSLISIQHPPDSCTILLRQSGF